MALAQPRAANGHVGSVGDMNVVTFEFECLNFEYNDFGYSDKCLLANVIKYYKCYYNY